MPTTSSLASSTRRRPALLGCMRERLQEFSLSLNSEKTRLIEFGRHAVTERPARARKAGDLQFLGVHLHLQQSRRGKFLLKRKTRRDRMRAKLRRSRRNCDGGCISPFPNRDDGWRKWSAASSRITPCQPIPALRPSITMSRSLAAHVTASQSEGSHDVAADHEDRIRLSSAANHPSSVAEMRFAVTHPRWEPRAGIPLARFCAGGGR